MATPETIYINTNRQYRALWKLQKKTHETRFVKWWKNYPGHKVEKSNPILQRIRSIKKQKRFDSKKHAYLPKDIAEIPKCNETKHGNMKLEAEFEHEFLRNRSKGFAYTPIIISGNNANVLH
jgi:Xaa-Pro aminopeptidase